MKKLSTFLGIYFLVNLLAATTATAVDLRRGYENGFIFQEGAVEFAVFPDGQFDFNYIDQIAELNFNRINRNTGFSFNTGFFYDPFIQYDVYGAVTQIENIPIFYDSFGRIIQAGNVFISYRNGFVNRIGNLSVFYRRPGIIWRTSGFVNRFNRVYVYQPWHGFYGVPFVNNCIVWNTPYRDFYNPIRYDWAYHRLNWDRPYYYNGRYSDFNNFRNFYRPNDRVVFQSFERGRRDNRGRIIEDRSVTTQRADIATGRRTVARDRSLYTATSRTSDTGRTSNAVDTRPQRTDNNAGARATNTGTTDRRNAVNGREAATDNNTSRSSVNTSESTRANRSTRNTTTIPAQRQENVNNAVESRNSRTVEPNNATRATRTEQINTSQRNVRTNTAPAAAPQREVRTVAPRQAAPQQVPAQREVRTAPREVAPQRASRPAPAPPRATETRATPAQRTAPAQTAPVRNSGSNNTERRGTGRG